MNAWNSTRLAEKSLLPTMLIYCIVFLSAGIPNSANCEPKGRIIGLSAPGNAGGFGSMGFYTTAISIEKIDLETGSRQSISTFSPTEYSLTAYTVDYFKHIAYFQSKTNNTYSIMSLDLNTEILSNVGQINSPFANFTVDFATGYLVGLAFEMPENTSFIDASKGGFVVGGSHFQIYDPTQKKIIATSAIGDLTLFNPAILAHDLDSKAIYFQKHNATRSPFIAASVTNTDESYSVTWSNASSIAPLPLSSLTTFKPSTQWIFGTIPDGLSMGLPMGHALASPSFYLNTMNSLHPSFKPANTSNHNALSRPEDIDNEIIFLQRQNGSTVLVTPIDTASGDELSGQQPTDSVLHAAVFDVPTIDYVALGDSYSAGTGADDYFYSGKFDNKNTFCHRSANAYSMQIDLSQYYPGKRIRKWFYACHGAETRHIIDTPWDGFTKDTKTGELPQSTRTPRQHADIISLTIGGNDLQFAPIMTALACGTGPDDPVVDEEIFEKLPLKDLYTTAQREDFTLRSALAASQIPMASRILKTLQSLRENSKSGSKIYYLSYPNLFPETTTPSENSALEQCLHGVLTKTDVDFANQEVQNLNAIIKKQCIANNIYYVDVTTRFKGHEACAEAFGNIPYMTNIDLFDMSKPQLINIFSESFHPNIAGHTQYALALQEKIVQTMGESQENSLEPTVSDDIQPTMSGSTDGMARLGPLRLDIQEETDKSLRTDSILILSGGNYLPNTSIFIMSRNSKGAQLTELAQTMSDASGNFTYSLKINKSKSSSDRLTSIVSAGMASETQAQLLVATTQIATANSILPILQLLLQN